MQQLSKLACLVIPLVYPDPLAYAARLNHAHPHYRTSPLDYAIMPAKSRFTRLDAFTKTVDEARVRTTSGGIVTIASLLIVLYLVWGEWADYRRIVVHPELIVDKGRGMCLHAVVQGSNANRGLYVQVKRWKSI